MNDATATPARRTPRRELNLTRADRTGCAVVGAALLLWGVRRAGLVRLALGAALLHGAYTGRNPLLRRLGLRVNPDPPHGASETLVVCARANIGLPRETLYRYWRNFANLPRFMHHLIAVRVVDDRRSHWMAQAPAGRIVEWDSELVEDDPGRLLRWCSLPGSEVTSFGMVRFEDAPAGQATDLHVELQYVPPGGAFGAVLARATGEEPQIQLADDLARLGELARAGVVTAWGAQPANAAL